MPVSNPLFQANHITCGYGTQPVVQDVSFSVQPGEMLCILGSNGCGKSTLLKAAAGLLPCSGQVLALGQDFLSLERRQAARTLAFLSQQSSPAFGYTVEQTVAMGRYAHRSKGLFQGQTAQDAALVQQALEQTGLWELRHRTITQLSGGQLQRVFLARVFAQDPRIILLDEPTNHLDLKYQLDLMQHLRRWLEGPDRCVVGVLHDLNLALHFADSLLLMEQGKALCQSPVQQLDLTLLNQVYGMDVHNYMQTVSQRWR